MEVNKCSLVNVKFAIPEVFDIFGCHHPDNQEPTVLLKLQLNYNLLKIAYVNYREMCV